ncbi:hypothetical protein M9H77_29884 [Catharanthus roseus]|uniref:Uncharacterized protein n=1 Tax=Catharanthus roseus TaxID=4058 RepID=A0ACB9ZYA5_CATRO|nr:hypothetical protein M9H77_29884 [Catharanthus roseus]
MDSYKTGSNYKVSVSNPKISPFHILTTLLESTTTSQHNDISNIPDSFSLNEEEESHYVRLSQSEIDGGLDSAKSAFLWLYMEFKTSTGFPISYVKGLEICSSRRRGIGQFFRIQALLQVQKSLCRCILVPILGSGKIKVSVQYQRLPTFFFFCEQIGHTFTHCDVLKNICPPPRVSRDNMTYSESLGILDKMQLDLFQSKLILQSAVGLDSINNLTSYHPSLSYIKGSSVWLPLLLLPHLGSLKAAPGPNSLSLKAKDTEMERKMNTPNSISGCIEKMGRAQSSPLMPRGGLLALLQPVPPPAPQSPKSTSYCYPHPHDVNWLDIQEHQGVVTRAKTKQLKTHKDQIEQEKFQGLNFDVQDFMGQYPKFLNKLEIENSPW